MEFIRSKLEILSKLLISLVIFSSSGWAWSTDLVAHKAFYSIRRYDPEARDGRCHPSVFRPAATSLSRYFLKAAITARYPHRSMQLVLHSVN